MPNAGFSLCLCASASYIVVEGVLEGLYSKYALVMFAPYRNI